MFNHLVIKARQAALLLLQRQQRLVTAESCTGGLLASVLTELPGSSAWFDGGWVTYSNALKSSQLHIPVELIERQGAVSQAVATLMAEQARMIAAVDYSLAITGIAGPSGGSDHKPVGTVWIALASTASVTAHSHHFSGDRTSVRQQSVLQALIHLNDLLLAH